MSLLADRPTTYTTANHGMVATTHPLAAQIGLDILQSGGNAIDAAIATSAAMGLMEPMSCGIGGDLFAIIYINDPSSTPSVSEPHPPSTCNGHLFALNASGRSPQNLNLDIFQQKNLTEIPNLGPLSWSVPGCVDGWHTLLQQFGTRPLADLLAPSIHYARNGFPVPATIAAMWHNATPLLNQSQDAAATYLPNGIAPKVGESFANPNLANTYELLAKHGKNAFYHGPIAQQIVDFSNHNGGYFSLPDFADHTSTWVAPVSTNYRGYDVHQIPPPGQGISVLQMLNLLEPYDLAALGPNSPDWWHLFIETKKIAYADRAHFYTDPNFANVPTNELISKSYANERRKLIKMDHAIDHLDHGDPKLKHSDTIYLTVVDKDRNCVSLIQSNYRGFGSGLVPGALGFVLQNRGNLFALDPHHPNCFAPKKRPFHTIIPAFVTKDSKPYFCFGVMGGDMQPQGQVQVLANMIDFGMNIHDAGAAPRMMHEGSATPTGLPAKGSGTISAEKDIPQQSLETLKSRGHNITHGPTNNGGYQGILLTPQNTLQGASEPRRDGRALGY